jgi:HEAT repeat protein
VVAGHLGDEDAARRALRGADDGAAAAGLGALARMGALTADDLAGALATDGPTLRRRACELAASTWRGEQRLDALLARALDDGEPLVVDAACFALGERTERLPPAMRQEAIERLSALSATHREAHVREGAVAALGAIGDPRGLPAVLAALTDRPTVRRRAAVALAAFDGEEAESALRRCLEDRDWQVRQVAETLLDQPPR